MSISHARGALALVFLTSLIAACAQGPATTAEAGWPMIVQRPEGIAGIDQRLTIGGNGPAVRQDGDCRVEGQVASETRIALQTLLQGADFRGLLEGALVSPA